MVFVPIVPHVQHDDRDSNILLLCKTKKVVVKDMDFIIRTGYIESMYNLEDEIKKLANGREVIDYQVMPYSTSTYGTYVEKYLVIVTCKK